MQASTCMEADPLDDTKQKIIDATMSLVRDKGYVATTTKDIAKLAHVNECTIFRKFNSKKDIVLYAFQQEQWNPNITPDIFRDITWDLKTDLEMFMNNYLERVTADFVNLSIGLRAPQIYVETAPLIMKIPEAFIKSLTNYLEQMYHKGKIPNTDFECMAMTIFSSTFGFTFLKASFGDKLSNVKQQDYIKKSVVLFVDGILNFE
jgi:AcrR family transcriptional regulator